MTEGVVRFRSALRESASSDSGADVLLALAGAAAAARILEAAPRVSALLLAIQAVGYLH